MPLLSVLTQAHATGTVLPRGFFLVLGLIYLLALALDRLAERLRLPASAAVLLLGLGLHNLLDGRHHIGLAHVETVEKVSMALLFLYAGLGTDLRRIRGSVGAALRLAILGALITLGITGVMLLLLPGPLAAGLRPGGGGIPMAVAWLAASCLTALDGNALEDLLRGLHQAVSGRLTHLLQFEAATSTLLALLSFGCIAGMVGIQDNVNHLDLHAELALAMPMVLIGRFVLAGLLSGAVVGVLAPAVIDRLVRSESHLLLVSIALAFVAYGLGQWLGGGGMLAVFSTGMWLSNGHYRLQRFDQHALHRALHPFNTAAEFSVLLLLGLTVSPGRLTSALPLAILLALALPLARLVSVWLALPGRSFQPRERLLVACCGIRGAVPLGLSLALLSDLPHLRGVPAAIVSPLGGNLIAVIFLVVLINLLLQAGLMQVLGPPSPLQGRGPAEA